MPRFKSQWEFGELFPPEATRHVVSVAELTAKVRRALEAQIGEVWVTGEVTNFRLQSSGHIYFTLKDATAQVACVLFRTEAGIDRAVIADGRHLIVRGDLTVYETRGQYQLRITAVDARGEGALQAAFERLKKQLAAEGLFAQERKRPLPRFANRIGIVTSPTGAALRDVLQVIRRRDPSLELVLVPCRVQGASAKHEIASALEMLNDYHRQSIARGRRGLDLILVTRGGGSLEDLWAFNEVEVARAIHASALPVVSAVGHEIDFTISDLVADLRAATPTAAGEIITEGVYSSCEFLEQCGDRLRFLVMQAIQHRQDNLDRIQQSLKRLHPRRILENRLQNIDDLQERLGRCTRHALRQATREVAALEARLALMRPAFVLREKKQRLRDTFQRLRTVAASGTRSQGARLESAFRRLHLLGPDQVLARGYSITRDAATGTILKAASEVSPGQNIITRLAKGEVNSTVT